jgi:hypothetical protein
VRWRAGEPSHCAAFAATTRFRTGDCASSAARSGPLDLRALPQVAGGGAVGRLSSLPPSPPLGTAGGAVAPESSEATGAPAPVVRGVCCCGGGGDGSVAALQGCSGSGARNFAAAMRFSRGASLRPCASSALRQQVHSQTLTTLQGFTLVWLSWAAWQYDDGRPSKNSRNMTFSDSLAGMFRLKLLSARSTTAAEPTE